jgi:hypothetical protein
MKKKMSPMQKHMQDMWQVGAGGAIQNGAID